MLNPIVSIRKRIQNYRDASTVKNDNRRIQEAAHVASRLIHVADVHGKPVIMYDGTVLLRITNESEIKNGTIALEDVQGYLSMLRQNFTEQYNGLQGRGVRACRWGFYMVLHR